MTKNTKTIMREGEQREYKAMPILTPAQQERFWANVDRAGDDECWRWLGTVHPSGYGYFGLNYQNYTSHRVAYGLIRQSVPTTLTLDHLCGNTSCVNPRHLEPVTAVENVARATARRVTCKRGHEFTPENTLMKKARGRRCRACYNEAQRISWRLGKRKRGANG